MGSTARRIDPRAFRRAFPQARRNACAIPYVEPLRNLSRCSILRPGGTGYTMRHLTHLTNYLADAAPAAIVTTWQNLVARFEPGHVVALAGRRAD